MSEQEHEILTLENQFPPVYGSAFATARKMVLDSGQSVLQSEGGFIYRVFPDGKKVLVKEIEPPTQVIFGSIFTLR